jgi:hypothetical protein
VSEKLGEIIMDKKIAFAPIGSSASQRASVAGELRGKGKHQCQRQAAP